jgi:hypothetical protein
MRGETDAAKPIVSHGLHGLHGSTGALARARARRETRGAASMLKPSSQAFDVASIEAL